MAVAVVHDETALLCTDCGRSFKNSAGLGAHTSRIHGVRPDGTPVQGEVDVRFTFGKRNIGVKMGRSQAREILARYPDDVLDAMME